MVRRVHPRSLGSLGSSGSFGLLGVRPRSRGVHPGSLGSLGCATWVVLVIRVRCVTWSPPSGSSAVA